MGILTLNQICVFARWRACRLVHNLLLGGGQSCFHLAGTLAGKRLWATRGLRKVTNEPMASKLLSNDTFEVFKRHDYGEKGKYIIILIRYLQAALLLLLLISSTCFFSLILQIKSIKSNQVLFSHTYNLQYIHFIKSDVM